MNDLERQVFAAAFAAAFERDWNFYVTHQDAKEAMRRTANGFKYAEIADQAVESLRLALTCDDSEYLLAKMEQWRQ